MRSQKTVYNIISNILFQITLVIYGFIVPKIIITYFGSSVNGLISSINQFLTYIILLESGLGPVVKAALYKPIAENDKKTIINILSSSEKFFKTIAFIFLGYTIFLSFTYPLIVQESFNYLYTFSLIIIMAISTFAEYYFGITYRLYLQAEQSSYIISIIQIVTCILSTILIIILAKLGVNIQIIKLTSALIFTLRPLLQNIYVKKIYHINLQEADKNYNLKEKWDGLSQHIAYIIHSNTDIILLTIFCSLKEVSVYSVYYLVIKALKSLVQAISDGVDASFGDMIAKNEQANLNKKFSMYEVVYYTTITCLFTCTILLITPFISIYTKEITDANYYRPIFGYLLVISEYIWSIRLPYGSLILSANHFKETKNGAWVEALLNLTISLALVSKYNLIGVTIGTIIAMLVRTIEYIYHANKYILKRNISINLKKIFTLIIESILIIYISKFLPLLEFTSYINFIINGFFTFLLSLIITLIINYLFYHQDFQELFTTLKKFLKRKIA